MKAVFYTFYNSKLDIDYSIYTEYYPELIIFYCYKAPKNIFGRAKLVDLNSQLELYSSDYILSRIVKFQPWRFIDSDFDNFIYFDFRIKLSKKFIDYSAELKDAYFFKHREGGILKSELLRVIVRDKINLRHLRVFLETFHSSLGLPITENGVFVINKKYSLALEKIEPWLKLINRDQLLTPIFFQDQVIKTFDFNLKKLSYIYVRPKELSCINYLKLLINELLLILIRGRERFKQC